MLKEYKITQGDNVINVAGKTLGGMDNIIALIQDSGGLLLSVDDDLSSLATQNIPYDDALYQKRAPELLLRDNKNAPTTGTIKALDLQSSIDLCLEAYGDLNNYISFLTVNSISGTNEGAMYGKEIIFDLVNEGPLRKSLIKNNIRFTTLFELQNYRIIETAEDRIIDTSEQRVVN